jgi:hypothetical protein
MKSHHGFIFSFTPPSLLSLTEPNHEVDRNNEWIQ